MKVATAHIEGIGSYIQSRFHGTQKLNKELADAYEERTWREKLHVDQDGIIYIPALAFKNCMSEIAKFLSVQIPGKGKSTYTKHFEAGVMVPQSPTLGIKKEDALQETMFVPSDGIRGSGKRVIKYFPRIQPGWKCSVNFVIADETITPDVFEYHLKQAGMLIGIGAFRVRNNGMHGQFRPISVEWKDLDEQ